MLHAPRQVGAGRLEEQVQMVVHEDEGEQFPAAKQDCPAQILEQSLTVMVIMNNELSPIAPSHDVINRPLILDSQSPWHAISEPKPSLRFNNLLRI
jgi:hypothetical protein